MQFHAVLPIMAEVADARVETAAGPRAVVAIWQEWRAGRVIPSSNRILGTYSAYWARAGACPVCRVCAQYVSGMTAFDAQVDVPFNGADGVEKHADELSGTDEIGKMRRTKPISLNP